MSLNVGFVETVLGPVDPKSLELEVILPHEHLYHHASEKLFCPRPPDSKYAHLASSPFDTELLWWINFHPYSHKTNLIFTDVESQEAIRKELLFFKDNGGGCMVECTTFGRDLEVFRKMSQDSGVHIVSGTGYYVNMSQPEETHKLPIESLYSKMKSDVLTGVNGIRSGILGELGSCFPLHDFEKNVLRAAGKVHEEYPSLPVSLHPGRNKHAPEEVMRIFLEAGGKHDKTVMCHLDRTFSTIEEHLDFASQFKTYLEFDLFGIEVSYYELSDEVDFISDAERIARLKALVEEGYEDKLVISHDIHTKHRLMDFGGHGFSHIPLNVIPKMKMRGFTQNVIDKITKKNPCRWLTL